MPESGCLGLARRARNMVTFTLNRCPKCGYPEIVFDEGNEMACHCGHCGWSSPAPPSSGVASSLSFWLAVAAVVLLPVVCLFRISDNPLRATVFVLVTSGLAIFMSLVPLVLPYPYNKGDTFSIVTSIIEGLVVLAEVSLLVFALFGVLPDIR